MPEQSAVRDGDRFGVFGDFVVVIIGIWRCLIINWVCKVR